MKIAALTVTLSALAVSVIATNAMAANPNGPKPKCPPGQILVVENNQYQCEQPSIKAKTKPAERATSGKRVQKPTKPKLPVIKPIKAQIKLPDLRIVSAKLKPGTPNVYIVRVKNQGQAVAPSQAVWGAHYLKNNTSWGGATIFPAIPAGAAKQLELMIPTPNNDNSLGDKFGDKIVFDADFQKKVVESNEKNNKFTIKYPLKNPT